LKELAMSKPILVGYDPRQADHAPVEPGLAVARFTGAPLIVAIVDGRRHRRHDHRTGHIDDDLIAGAGPALIGSRGYGPRRAVLLGSVSRRLMEDAHSPTIVLPRVVEGALASLLAESGSTGVTA
jgi:hypothetical protein